MKLRRILCPVDFSDASHAALDAAEGLAKDVDAELVLVHVIEPVLYPVAYGMAATATLDLEDEARAGAQSALQPLADALSGRGVRCTTHLASGTASSTICDLVGELEADLVVMSTHGFTGVRHLLIGSTTERVVRRCPCPVLTVKAGDAAG
jgi:nucleotide-binding universal stress UspA family protein